MDSIVFTILQGFMIKSLIRGKDQYTQESRKPFIKNWKMDQIKLIKNFLMIIKL